MVTGVVTAGIVAAAMPCLSSGTVGAANDMYKDTYIQPIYVEYAEEISEEYDICPELIEAIIEYESSGRADARNGSAIGLCQVKPYGDYTAEDLEDPYTNIRAACEWFEYNDHRGIEIADALARYHGEKKHEGMSRYVEKVLERSAELERAHNK